MTDYRMISQEVCDKLEHMVGPLREMGADSAASLIEAIVHAPVCPIPSWPEARLTLLRLIKQSNAFRAMLQDEDENMKRLSSQIKAEGKHRMVMINLSEQEWKARFIKKFLGHFRTSDDRDKPLAEYYADEAWKRDQEQDPEESADDAAAVRRTNASEAP